MEAITENDLKHVGFVPVMKDHWEKGINTPVPTDSFTLKTFDPAPVINLKEQRRNARIGSTHFDVTTHAQLDRFLGKVIPAFCEFI